MLRQTPNWRHRLLAPANADLESSYESRPGYHTVEVHTQAGPTQVSLHNQAVEALVSPNEEPELTPYGNNIGSRVQQVKPQFGKHQPFDLGRTNLKLRGFFRAGRVVPNSGGHHPNLLSVQL